ncbi:Indolepyruvate oxidoreductase subunit [Desulfonema limicola]|uniref:Indolepyruvate oxidoreductase subunit n=1 Tax=Desulfonema limicola TaxID=45656 RepID=A0A975GE58_9BACT|nr:2-oxoacid:acceptor oxidoreductase family protein [Desulfonema limicola]QTA77892.1 Indolepyruvate oxidoreductase subunit [Desulfonema limicola]
MNSLVQQQIVISGVGGQGVLFVTRLLAEAAIKKGCRVFTSETHGMAQRGGTVLSHLKAGEFTSPLIRSFKADGILALKSENMIQHSSFLKPGAWAVINSPKPFASNASASFIDADRLAEKISSPKSVNLILLGFALAKVPDMFCTFEDIKLVVEDQLKDKKELLKSSLKAVETGYEQ